MAKYKNVRSATMGEAIIRIQISLCVAVVVVMCVVDLQDVPKTFRYLRLTDWKRKLKGRGRVMCEAEECVGLTRY